MVIEQKFVAGQEPDPTEFLFISLVSFVQNNFAIMQICEIRFVVELCFVIFFRLAFIQKLLVESLKICELIEFAQFKESQFYLQITGNEDERRVDAVRRQDDVLGP